MSNFIQKCLNGEALLEDIDDYVDAWHESDSDEPLHAYLGMTREENAHWVENPDSLPYIIDAHKSKITYQEAVARAASIAARSSDAGKMSQIQAWLNSRGKDA